MHIRFLASNRIDDGDELYRKHTATIPRVDDSVTIPGESESRTVLSINHNLATDMVTITVTGSSTRALEAAAWQPPHLTTQVVDLGLALYSRFRR